MNDIRQISSLRRGRHKVCPYEEKTLKIESKAYPNDQDAELIWVVKKFPDTLKRLDEI